MKKYFHSLSILALMFCVTFVTTTAQAKRLSIRETTTTKTVVQAKKQRANETKPPYKCPYVSTQLVSTQQELTQVVEAETNTNTIKIKNKLGVPIVVNQVTLKIEHKNATNLQNNFEVIAIDPINQTFITNTVLFSATSNNTGIATVNFGQNFLIGKAKEKKLELMIIPHQNIGMNDTIHNFEVNDINFSSRNGPSQFIGCPNIYEVHHGNASVSANPINLTSTHVYDTGQLLLDTNILPGSILTPNETKNIFSINFSAGIDDIEISDIYLENDTNNDEIPDNTAVAQMVEFKLFDHDGQLLAQEQMDSNGKIKFELTNTNRIVVLKNESTLVFVEITVRSNFPTDFVARKLKLSIDTNNSINGVTAISATNGLPLNNNSVFGDPASSEFIIHKSKFSINHAAVQPTFSPAASNPNGNALYRFEVTADQAGDIELAMLNFDITSTTGVLNTSNATNGQDLIIAKYSNIFYSGNAVIIQNLGLPASSTSSDKQSFGDMEKFIFAIPETVQAGSTAYYELRTKKSINNTSSQNDSIATTIESDTTPNGMIVSFLGSGTIQSQALTNTTTWQDNSFYQGSKLFVSSYFTDIAATYSVISE